MTYTAPYHPALFAIALVCAFILLACVGLLIVFYRAHANEAKKVVGHITDPITTSLGLVSITLASGRRCTMRIKEIHGDTIKVFGQVPSRQDMTPLNAASDTGERVSSQPKKARA